MPRFRILLLLIAALALGNACVAETSPARRPFVIPTDINGYRTLFPAPSSDSASRPLLIGIFEGEGSAESGITNVIASLRALPAAQIIRLDPESILRENLSRFDVLAFTGGYSVRQAKSLGPAGKDAVRRYVAEGGRYFGICAGAYLAVVGEEWSLGLLNARLAPGNRWRGQTFLDIELTPEGRAALAPVDVVFKIRYNNGPVIRPLGRPDLPPYVVLASFRGEIVRKDGQPGIMMGTPAIVMAPYGRGRVLTISPHAENTPGIENLIPLAIIELTRTFPPVAAKR